MISQDRFDEILSRFTNTKVAVLGDFFLDLYIQLDRSLSELSLETQKEAFQAVDLRGQPGAAGVVVNNLSSLGAQTGAIGFVGSDGNGFTLLQALRELRVDTSLMIETAERFTPTYIKPMMREINGFNIELNRIDIINRTPNSEKLNISLADNLNHAIHEYDGILVLEQVKIDGNGTMSPFLRSKLRDLVKAYPGKIIMADSRHFAHKYQGISLKMNQSEAQRAMSFFESQNKSEIRQDLISTSLENAKLFWQIHKKPSFISLGEQGICGVDNNSSYYYPAFRIDGSIDIVGAGDSVLAGIGLALSAGATASEAAYIGNLIGSIIVQQIGTTGRATQTELKKRHLEYQDQQKTRKS